MALLCVARWGFFVGMRIIGGGRLGIGDRGIGGDMGRLRIGGSGGVWAGPGSGIGGVG